MSCHPGLLSLWRTLGLLARTDLDLRLLSSRGDAEGTEGVIEGWADLERQDLAPRSAHDLGRETGSSHPGLVSPSRTLGICARTTAVDLNMKLLSSREVMLTG